MNQSVIELLKLTAAPDVDLDVFDGNALEFKYFMMNFREMVEKKVPDPAGRLMRLLKYTQGEPKELIKGCVYKPASEGYRSAIELLTGRYGDAYRILASYRSELKQWKAIRLGDGAALRSFYVFLMKCHQIVEGQFSNTLNSPDNLCAVVAKLPVPIRDRWNRRVLTLRTDFLREPTLNDLIVLIEKESKLADDPLFSRSAMNDSQMNNSNLKGEKPVRTFTSKVECVLCAKAHDLDVCFQFKAMSVKERSKWLLRARRCFGCYAKGHISKNCKRRRKCKVCKGLHPTGLHRDNPENADDLTAVEISVDENKSR